MRAENHNEMGCPREDRLKTEGTAGARSGVFSQRVEESGAGYLLAKALDRNNLNRAYERVKANRGAPGVDGMAADELLPLLKAHGGS